MLRPEDNLMVFDLRESLLAFEEFGKCSGRSCRRPGWTLERRTSCRFTTWSPDPPVPGRTPGPRHAVRLPEAGDVRLVTSRTRGRRHVLQHQDGFPRAGAELAGRAWVPLRSRRAPARGPRRVDHGGRPVRLAYRVAGGPDRRFRLAARSPGVPWHTGRAPVLRVLGTLCGPVAFSAALSVTARAFPGLVLSASRNGKVSGASWDA